MAGPNRITLQISGIRYPIKTYEETDYVFELAGEIDSTVAKLMSAGTASLNEALLLTALSYLDSCKKAEAGCDNLRAEVTQYLEDYTKLRCELADAKREIQKLKSKPHTKLEKPNEA